MRIAHIEVDTGAYIIEDGINGTYILVVDGQFFGEHPLKEIGKQLAKGDWLLAVTFIERCNAVSSRKLKLPDADTVPEINAAMEYLFSMYYNWQRSPEGRRRELEEAITLVHLSLPLRGDGTGGIIDFTTQPLASAV